MTEFTKEVRQRGHAKSVFFGEPSSWWIERVVRITADWYPTYEEAASAEIRAIGAEAPLHNVRHKRPVPLPPLRRITLSTASVTGTLGGALGMASTGFPMTTTAFLPGFAPQCGTSTVN